MVSSSKIEFYESKPYENILKNKFKKINARSVTSIKKKVLKLLNIKDKYISLYLILHIDCKERFIDTEILIRLSNLFKEIKTLDAYKVVDLNMLMIPFVKKFLSDNIEIDAFISCICNLNMKDEDYSSFLHIFGYNQIYKYYKKLTKDVMKIKYGYNHIGIVMKMVDNPSLCFQNLLPLFSRLTIYVNDNIIEKNIVSCCIILIAIKKYVPEILVDKNEYVLSLTSFLVRIFYDSSNFTFIDIDGVDIIVKAIFELSEFNEEYFKMSNISYGIYCECYENLNNIIQKNSAIYEDIVAAIGLLKILSIYYELSYKLGCRMHDYDGTFLFIQSIHMCRPNYISECDWNLIDSKFLQYKYEMLDVLFDDTKNENFDTSLVVDDVLRTENAYPFLTSFNRMLKYIDWVVLIVPANDEKHCKDFIKIIFNEEFLRQENFENHYIYIHIYLESLYKRNEVDFLLLAAHFYIQNSYKCISHTSHHYLLASFYVFNIDVYKDHRVVKRRNLILNRVLSIEAENYLIVFIDKFIIRLRESSVFTFNGNVISLLVLIGRKVGRDILGIPHKIYLYILNCIEKEHEILNKTKNNIDGSDLQNIHCGTENIENMNKDHEENTEVHNKKINTDKNQLEELHSEFQRKSKSYISVCVYYLVKEGKELELWVEDPHYTEISTFYRIIIALVSYLRGNYSESYLEKIKNYSFNYILSTNEMHIKELGLLFKECDKKIKTNTDEGSSFLQFYDKFLKESFGFSET